MDNEFQIRILNITPDYKGFTILFQQIGQIFQAVMTKDKEVRQFHIVMKYPKKKNHFSLQETKRATTYIQLQAQTIIDMIVDGSKGKTKGKKKQSKVDEILSTANLKPREAIKV